MTSEPSLFSTAQLTAEVALPLPIPGTFSYLLPENLLDQAQTGVRVKVPFKNRELVGYIVDKKEITADFKMKSVLEVLDSSPVLNPRILQLTRWISDYYGSSWGESIENALPKWVKYGKKAAKALAKDSENIAPPHSPIKPSEFELSKDQAQALQKIKDGLNHPSPKPFLLFGVTGSGKSEVYIRAIKEALHLNGSAICLVPEIALTEQIRRFFLGHFGTQLEILHSKLTDSERFLAWKRIESGEKTVILGPRSAVFAPLKNLKLIIMDEEHESTYKQETTPRYHAREVAQWRAQNENALFIMGTATPSLETMRRAQQGEIIKLDLNTRIDDRAMPSVDVLDIKEIFSRDRKFSILTHRLANEIEINLKKGEGTMLLLNRRGFSTHISCPKCGQIENCISCQVSLTFHQESGELLCHYCNYHKAVSDICTQCSSPVLKFSGFGTEKVESELAKRFPAARIARMDADTVQKRGSHEAILQEFRQKKIDILIGTQMIAKGFDFPHVTLVGVILADVGLMLPDFRSAERTFQLLTQVAGRAGRGNIPGRVVVQTFSPDHPSIRFSKNHDYLNFYDYETRERYEFNYPPYCRLMNIIIRSKFEKKAYQAARELRDHLQTQFKDRLEAPAESKIQIIGPAPLPFYKLRGHFRWHLMIKCPLHQMIQGRELLESLSKIQKISGIQTAIDVDPANIL